jgi:hypothetical protein
MKRSRARTRQAAALKAAAPTMPWRSLRTK